MMHLFLYYTYNNYNTHIKRVGKLNFWVLVTAPLVAFYLGFVSAYGELYQMGFTVNKEQSVIKVSFPIAFTIPLVLNGIGFRSVGKLAKNSCSVMEHMTCTAYGILFYFIAANSTVAAAGYPPFGLGSLTFVLGLIWHFYNIVMFFQICLL